MKDFQLATFTHMTTVQNEFFCIFLNCNFNITDLNFFWKLNSDVVFNGLVWLLSGEGQAEEGAPVGNPKRPHGLYSLHVSWLGGRNFLQPESVQSVLRSFTYWNCVRKEILNLKTHKQMCILTIFPNKISLCWKPPTLMEENIKKLCYDATNKK